MQPLAMKKPKKYKSQLEVATVDQVRVHVNVFGMRFEKINLILFAGHPFYGLGGYGGFGGLGPAGFGGYGGYPYGVGAPLHYGLPQVLPATTTSVEEVV